MAGHEAEQAELETLRAQIDALEAEGKGDATAPLLEKCARLLQKTGEHEEATYAFISAATMLLGEYLDLPAEKLVEAAARSAEAAGLLPELAAVRAEIAMMRDEPVAAVAAWKEALGSDDADVRFDANTNLARTLARTAAGHDDALRYAKDALAGAVAAGDDKATFDARAMLAHVHVLRGEHEEVRAELDRASTLVAADDQPGQAKLAFERATAAFARGDEPTALDEAGRAITLARQCGDQSFVPAAIFLSRIHESADRMVDAYDVLMRAKKELGGRADLVAHIDRAFEQLVDRLGERFADVHAQWVELRAGDLH